MLRLGFPDVGAQQGQVVCLEPLSVAHVLLLTDAATGDRNGYALTDVPSNAESMAAYVRRALNQEVPGGMRAFAVVRRADGRVVGSTRFCYPEYWRWHHGRPAGREEGRPDAAQIGYTWLTPEARRSGANMESKLMMLRVAFESWALTRVSFRTDRRNVASRLSLLALGAHFEGVLRATSPAYDGGIRDSASYSILADEWPQVRDRLQARIERHVGG